MYKGSPRIRKGRRPTRRYALFFGAGLLLTMIFGSTGTAAGAEVGRLEVVTVSGYQCSKPAVQPVNAVVQLASGCTYLVRGVTAGAGSWQYDAAATDGGSLTRRIQSVQVTANFVGDRISEDIDPAEIAGVMDKVEDQVIEYFPDIMGVVGAVLAVALALAAVRIYGSRFFVMLVDLMRR